MKRDASFKEEFLIDTLYFRLTVLVHTRLNKPIFYVVWFSDYDSSFIWNSSYSLQGFEIWYFINDLEVQGRNLFQLFRTSFIIVEIIRAPPAAWAILFLLVWNEVASVDATAANKPILGRKIIHRIEAFL